MNKAIFLDRDGVINNGDLYYTYRKEDFKFNPDIFEALKLLHQAGFLLIVVSNQSGVAKNEYTYQDVEDLHRYMNQTFKEAGIFISEVYFCPHHESTGRCICRKPDSGMIEKAIARFDIDPTQSFLIGDSDRDIESAEKVGVKGVKVEKNSSILNICQEIIASKKD